MACKVLCANCADVNVKYGDYKGTGGNALSRGSADKKDYSNNCVQHPHATRIDLTIDNFCICI